MPYLSVKAKTSDYRSVKIYRCPSYPNKNQTVCFVNNGWRFTKPDDTTGVAADEPTRIFSIKKLDTKVYMADNEDGSWREIITKDTDPGMDKCDVWSIYHLPRNLSTTPEPRRIARTRHSQGKTRPGCHYLFLDGHVEWQPPGDEITDPKELIKKWNYDF